MTVELLNCDCMEYMATLEDDSFELIIVDPPYFEVKGEFDFIWKSFDDYLKDVDRWARECSRVLKKNGSLFWWGHAEKIAYSQVIIDKYLTLENHLKWEKIECQTRRMEFEESRCFAPVTEHLLFYSNNYEPDGWQKTGLERIMDENVKPNHPFALYMKSEFKRAGVSNKEIAALFPSKTGNPTGCVSNWLNGDNVPTVEQYEKIRLYLNGEYLRKEYEDLRKEYEDLRKEYEDLRKEYEDLRKEYEDLRRPFNNVMKLTDVLNFSQESHITAKYKHPTQKPPKLCRAIISTTGRKGGKILIPFLGSGVEAVEGFNWGMSVYGCELDPHYFKLAQERFNKETRQIDLLGGLK